MINTEFKSIIELIKAFPDEQTCINHLEQLRWNGYVVSPFDPTSKVYKCAGNKYRCKNTSKYFNVRTNTLFDNTKVPLQKWFMAIYLITAHKKGISSLQLGRDIDVTQKTAWFMNHRIRNCFGLNNENDGGDEKIGGEGVMIEVDETYAGGKVKNMNNKKRKEIKEGKRGKNDNKTGIMGYVERGGKLRFEVIKKGDSVKDMVQDHVDSGSVLMTDSATVYTNVGKIFSLHGVVDHSKGEYVNGVFHTNTAEGAFSLLDRMIIGIYHYASPKHMQKYVNEAAFRYNSRQISDSSRFNLLLKNSANRLTYKNLIK